MISNWQISPFQLQVSSVWERPICMENGECRILRRYAMKLLSAIMKCVGKCSKWLVVMVITLPSDAVKGQIALEEELVAGNRFCKWWCISRCWRTSKAKNTVWLRTHFWNIYSDVLFAKWIMGNQRIYVIWGWFYGSPLQVSQWVKTQHQRSDDFPERWLAAGTSITWTMRKQAQCAKVLGTAFSRVLEETSKCRMWLVLGFAIFWIRDNALACITGHPYMGNAAHGYVPKNPRALVEARESRKTGLFFQSPKTSTERRLQRLQKITHWQDIMVQQDGEWQVNCDLYAKVMEVECCTPRKSPITKSQVVYETVFGCWD